MTYKFRIILLVILTLSGCGFQHSKESAGSGVDKSSLKNRAVSFQEVFQVVISPRCVSCHSAGAGNAGNVNLETYESIFPQLYRIQQSALVSKTMPKGSALTDEESSLLATWIEQGGSVMGRVGSGSKREPGPVRWPEIRDGVFSTCMECHSAPNPEANLDLTSLSVVREKALKIFERVVILQNMPMQPYPQLSQEEKTLLGQWMAEGMME